MIIAQHTLETTALPEAIWSLWADPASYSTWDRGLEWARLNGAFKLGATGTMKPSGGSVSGFTISELVEGRSFVLLAPLPFARLRFIHSMEPTHMGTRLTHRIEVEGPLAWIWGRLLRSALAANLATATRKLAQLAERPGTASDPK